MKLTIHLKKRWITTVLREAERAAGPRPWHRGMRSRFPLSRHTAAAPRLTLVRA